MAHVAFTPTTWITRAKRVKVPQDLANAVEDARVAGHMSRIGLPVPSALCAADTAKAMNRTLAMGDMDGMMRSIAGAHYAPTTAAAVAEWVDTIPADHPARPHIEAAAYEVRRLVKYATWGNAPYKSTLATAKRLMDLGTRAAEAIAAAKAAKDAAAKATKKSATKTPGAAKVPAYTPRGRGVRWMTMSIETAPLTRPAKRAPGRKWSSRDEGAIPTAFHRMVSDGRIFKRPAKRPTAYTVLIDCSGSMSFTPERLQSFLDAAPASIVALYSGNHSDGVLRIVAKGRRKADDAYIAAPSGGANGVDGPALRWLASQPGPRIWICDGYVTGVGDGSSPDLSDDARRVAAACGLMQVRNTGEALAVLTGKVRFTPGYSIH
jgi:hypothetical protein